MTSADLGIALLWIATVIGALNAAALAVILKRFYVAWYRNVWVRQKEKEQMLFARGGKQAYPRAVVPHRK